MQQPMQPILQHLFQASSLDDISRQRLEAFVEEYPSFGIGHYLLSRKLMAEDSERFAADIQKTSLYFTNPFWLQWQLDNAGLVGGRSEPMSSGHGHADGLVVDANPENGNAGHPAWELPERELLHAGDPVLNTEEKASIGREEEEWSPEEIGRVTAGEGESVEGDTAAVNGQLGQEGPSAAEELLLRLEEARGLRETMQKINHDYDAEGGAGVEDAAAMQERQPGVQEEAPVTIEEATAVQEEQPAAQEEAASTMEEQPVVQEEPAAVQGEPADESAVQEEPIHDEEAPFVLDEEEEKTKPQAAEQARPAIEMQPDAIPGAEATVPAQPDPTPEAPQAEPALVFEPYHTIDYFASQGIKLTLDENPSDPLGKQLKSFTDWLKGMRRLPQKDREVIPDRVAEQAVQNFAAHSIEGKEVVTETMAEVLEMQGMRERAKAVYEKLSLLNPDKRAYFAAKIDKLNIL